MNKLNKKTEVSPKFYKYTEVKRRLESTRETLKRREEKLELLQAEVSYLKKRISMYKSKLGLSTDN